jgi:hypothetical protein
MAERQPSPDKRSSFLTPGNWAYHKHRPRREAQRIVKWPTSPPPQKESAKPTKNVVGFMKWMRQLLDRVERQRQGRQNQRLARLALGRTTRAVTKPAAPPTGATDRYQPNPARLK